LIVARSESRSQWQSKDHDDTRRGRTHTYLRSDGTRRRCPSDDLHPAHPAGGRHSKSLLRDIGRSATFPGEGVEFGAGSIVGWARGKLWSGRGVAAARFAQAPEECQFDGDPLETGLPANRGGDRAGGSRLAEAGCDRAVLVHWIRRCSSTRSPRLKRKAARLEMQAAVDPLASAICDKDVIV
jgi:hypothetical protein